MTAAIKIVPYKDLKMNPYIRLKAMIQKAINCLGNLECKARFHSAGYVSLNLATLLGTWVPSCVSWVPLVLGFPY